MVPAGICPSDAHTGCTDSGSLLYTNYPAVSISNARIQGFRRTWDLVVFYTVGWTCR